MNWQAVTAICAVTIACAGAISFVLRLLLKSEFLEFEQRLHEFLGKNYVTAERYEVERNVINQRLHALENRGV